MADSICLEAVRLQVEYYLSNENLARDQVFRKEMIRNHGWLSMNSLRQCNQIKRMGANKEHILSALVRSDLEVAPDASAVRRSGNAPLPPLVARHAGHAASVMSQGVMSFPQGVLGFHYVPIGYAYPLLNSTFPAGHFGSAEAFDVQVHKTLCGPAAVEGPPAPQSFDYAPSPVDDHDHYNMAFHSQEKSREVQAAMDNFNNSKLEELAFTFKGSFVIACTHKNAHRVVLKLINLSPRTLPQLIIDEIFSNVWQIVRNKYGCRVVRDLVTHCGNQVQTLVKKILEHVPDLCRHEFGRYVAEAIIQFAGTEQRKPLEDYVFKHIVALCHDQETLSVMTGALSGPASATVATRILEQKDLVVSLARSRHGSQVVKHILNLPQCYRECVRQLAGQREQRESLKKTRYGRVVERAIADLEAADSEHTGKHQAGHDFPDTENHFPNMACGGDPRPSTDEAQTTTQDEPWAPMPAAAPLNMSKDDQVWVTMIGTTTQECMQHPEKHGLPVKDTFVHFNVIPSFSRRVATR